MRAFALSVISLVSVAGCAVATEGPGESSVEQAALVHVDRHDSTTTLAARYVRGSKLDVEALRASGGLFELPEIDQCIAFSHLGEGRGEAGRSIELVAAGTTLVTQGERVVELSPRSIPDVSDVVSGVVYSKSVALEPGAALVQLAGTEPLTVEIPTDLEDLELPSLEGDNDVVLRWRAGGGALVVVDVHSVSAGSFRCAMRDSGSASLERAMFGNDGTVVVRRLAHFEAEREAFQRVLVFAEASRTLAYKVAR